MKGCSENMDIALDLGTCNTRIFVNEKGKVLDEPSVITYDAIEKENKKVNRAFIGAALSLGANIEVVDNPGYKERPRSLEIKRVECNDTATILNMVVSGSPKEWARIKSSVHLSTDNGKQYKLLDCEGMELDKECYLPESGKMPFRLEYEPLPENAKMFDFSEGNDKGSWKINIRVVRINVKNEVKLKY